jgi:hypothetical protein
MYNSLDKATRYHTLGLVLGALSLVQHLDGLRVKVGKVSGSYSDEYEDECLLGCCTM